MARAFFPSLLLVPAVELPRQLWLGPTPEGGPEDLKPFDLRWRGYKPADATAYLNDLTVEAPTLYLGWYRVFDTLFPIGVLGGRQRLRPGAAPRRHGQQGAVLMMAISPALVYFGLDMAENAKVARILRSAPGPAETETETVTLAGAFTVWKFRFVAFAGLVLLPTIVAACLRATKEGR